MHAQSLKQLNNFSKLQNRLKGTLHWTPLFLKKKFQSDKYDTPSDRVGHWQEPHVFSFLICAFVFEL